MPTSNPLDILLEHDTWGTRQILAACEALSADQFARKFEMGPGSLQATLTHMIAAKKTWTDTLMERPTAPRIDQTGAVYSAEQLMRLHEESAAEFNEVARKHALEQIVKRVREGL
jgi:uncharacterized damage-inducible protein DinB